MSSAKKFDQPNLSSLLARYLQRQAEAQAQGLTVPAPAGAVVPHEVSPVQPIDAKPAWEEAIAVMRFYDKGDETVLQPPPSWPELVGAHEPATALAFCVGNFPQMVRNFQALIDTANLKDLRPGNAARNNEGEMSALAEWAQQNSFAKKPPHLLLALGALRLAKQFDAADGIVHSNDAKVPPSWHDAWANEKAALTWERGQNDDALACWQGMQASVPILFNRGMAALFCGRAAEAKKPLTEAVDQLPETSGWHHLGRLYLALASDSK
jgi:hypothetical protein